MSTLALLRARKRDHGPAGALLLANVALPQQALDALTQAPASPESAAARLAIAATYYQRGDVNAAESILTATTVQADRSLQNQRASLLARVLMAQQRFDEAVLPLAAMQQFGRLAPIDSYNLGIAWLQTGATARGAGELHALGSDAQDTPNRRALAEQANLVLAYWLINHDRAAQARSVLRRMPLAGAQARKAMLALGWAEFLGTDNNQPLTTAREQPCRPPDGALWQDAAPLHKHPRNTCDQLNSRQRQGLLESAPGYANANSRMQRAAVAWTAAAEDEDSRNPIAVEALSALPFAYIELGDQARAQAAFARAIKRLQQSLSGAGAPSQDLAIASENGARLQRLRRSMEAAGRHISDLAQSTARQSGVNNESEIVALLARLRATAPTGRSFAAPNPVQRGRLLMALTEREHRGSVDGAHFGNRFARIQSQIQDLLQRVQQLEGALTQSQWRKQRKALQLYLRQVTLGMADLTHNHAESP